MRKVFEIPSGPRDTDGVDGQTTTASIDFLKKNIDMAGNDSHSLKPNFFSQKYNRLSQTVLSYTYMDVTSFPK